MPIIQSPLKLKIVNSCALNGMKTYMGLNNYLFTCLPNGVSCAPRQFTKILKPPLATLHKQGHISVAHLDDLYLQGQIYEHMSITNVIYTIVLFEKLGLVVHPEKSCFILTQVLVILGFVINSVKMIIQLTTEKSS